MPHGEASLARLLSLAGAPFLRGAILRECHPGGMPSLGGTILDTG